MGREILDSTLPSFCGSCGTILPTPTRAPQTLECPMCGRTFAVKPQERLMCRWECRYEKDVSTHDAQGVEGGGDALVDHVCTKCGHTKATYATMQTRSADEGQTVFYTCVKCKKKDIEYS